MVRRDAGVLAVQLLCCARDASAALQTCMHPVSHGDAVLTLPPPSPQSWRFASGPTARCGSWVQAALAVCTRRCDLAAHPSLWWVDGGEALGWELQCDMQVLVLILPAAPPAY